MIYQLERRQIIPASLDQIWSYFADPRNLNEITPPDLEFEILFGGDQAMYQGQLIAYKIQLFPLLKTRWLTEISQVREPYFFADQQRLGPYRFWYHEHSFSQAQGGVEMRDRVTYQLPLGPLGDLVHALWVRSRLECIFDFRTRQVIEIFGE